MKLILAYALTIAIVLGFAVPLIINLSYKFIPTWIGWLIGIAYNLISFPTTRIANLIMPWPHTEPIRFIGSVPEYYDNIREARIVVSRLIYWFIIGAIIGLIIQKNRDKKEQPTNS